MYSRMYNPLQNNLNQTGSLPNYQNCAIMDYLHNIINNIIDKKSLII